ncbi:MAG: ATP-binding protein [Saprospiraceae bacterium]|nr:ATP-binding protein [Saprospiraceae bacterium]
MQKRYPFKFLDAYTLADSDFFFGRNDEIDALYQMVFQTDLLLVYGASGTGKTSLIQCGLASKFQSHDWLALNVRRGNNLNESLEKALETAATSVGSVSNAADANDAADATNLDWLDEDLSSETAPTAPAEPLSALARRFKAIYLRHFKPLYLIFDQFEELYILGNKDEQNQFVQTVREILRVKQPVKIILSIREEYLGHLYEFERAVPELLRKKLRVEPMNLDKVKTVIESVGQHADSLVRLRAGEETAIAEGIFEKIRGEEKTLHIPLPYLQVFLDKLYLHATDDKTRQTETEFSLQHLARIGDLGDVLRNFLDEQVRDIAADLPASEEQVWQMLSPFVTLEGTKEPLSDIQLADKIPDAAPALLRRALQAFVGHRILRFSESSQLYEIAHDSLAKQIHAKRSDEEIALLEVQRLVKSQTAMKAEAREFFSEKQLLFMEPYLSKYRPSAEEEAWIQESRAYVRTQKEAAVERQRAELEATQKRLRTVRGLLGAAVLAVLVAVYFGWDANRAKVLALQSRQETQNALDKVTREKANKAMLDIQNLRSRGETLLKNGFYTSALEMYQQADAIALPFSDLPEMQQQHQELTEKIAQCQQKKSR